MACLSSGWTGTLDIVGQRLSKWAKCQKGTIRFACQSMPTAVPPAIIKYAFSDRTLMCFLSLDAALHLDPFWPDPKR